VTVGVLSTAGNTAAEAVVALLDDSEVGNAADLEPDSLVAALSSCNGPEAVSGKSSGGTGQSNSSSNKAGATPAIGGDPRSFT